MVFSSGVLDPAAADRRFDAMVSLAEFVPFAKQPIVVRSSGEVVGYAGVDLYRLFGRPVLEFGWRLVPPARGRGCATEAARALVETAKAVYDGEIVTMIDPANEPSARVAAKVGFEGWKRGVVEGYPTDLSILRCRGEGLGPDLVTFRPMVEDDLGSMRSWLAADHVQAWWRDPSAPNRVEQKYGPRIAGTSPTEMFVVEFLGRPIGFAQRYLLRDHPDWARTLAHTGLSFDEAAGIDYAIGHPHLIGRGLGSELIERFTASLLHDHPDATEIVVTPQTANRGSCRVLDKAGYELRWTGRLESSDPGDEGLAALYSFRRQG